jgi:hypothetical protein
LIIKKITLIIKVTRKNIIITAKIIIFLIVSKKDGMNVKNEMTKIIEIIINNLLPNLFLFFIKSIHSEYMTIN